MTQDELPEPDRPASSALNNQASLPRRLVAGIIDLFLVDFFVTPLIYVFELDALVENPFKVPTDIALKMVVLMTAVFFVLNGYLLFRRGQTLGKKLLNIAIVDMQGRPVALPTLVVNRYLIQLAMLVVPLLNIADLLTMFIRRDRRCLHDLTAKTQVIDLRVKAQADPKSMIA